MYIVAMYHMHATPLVHSIAHRCLTGSWLFYANVYICMYISMYLCFYLIGWREVWLIQSVVGWNVVVPSPVGSLHLSMKKSIPLIFMCKCTDVYLDFDGWHVYCISILIMFFMCKFTPEVVTEWYQSMVQTLGLDGLYHR